jgi:transposase-like protein
VDGEVVVERRRQWKPEEKAALLAEVAAEGGRVSVVARRAGASTSLLYNGRSAWKAAAVARGAAIQPAGFVQLGVIAEASGQSTPMRMSAGAVYPRRTGLGRARRGDRNRSAGRHSGARRQQRQREGAAAGPGGGTRAGMIGLAPGARCFSPASRSIGAPGLTAWRPTACPGESRGAADYRRRSVQRPCLHLPQQARSLLEGVVLGWQWWDGSGGMAVVGWQWWDGSGGMAVVGWQWWDGSGLCLFAKRLERGKFVWPPLVKPAPAQAGGIVPLTPAQLALLIEAMDGRRTIAPPAPPRPMLV